MYNKKCKNTVFSIISRPNDEYQIVLDDNPTTGFIWIYTSNCPWITREIRRRNIFDKKNKYVIGAGSKLVITFKSTKSDILKFYHVRPWLVKILGDLTPDYIFEIKII
jgi:predicted secreted protein